MKKVVFVVSHFVSLCYYGKLEINPKSIPHELQQINFNFLPASF